MTALDWFVGGPDEPIRCRVINDVASVHWWMIDAQPGDKCLCGEALKRDDEGDQ